VFGKPFCQGRRACFQLQLPLPFVGCVAGAGAKGGTGRTETSEACGVLRSGARGARGARAVCVCEGARRAGEEAETEANPPLTSTVKLLL
jgi:hypothetical protein